MANEKRLIDANALWAEFMDYADTGIEFDGEGVANAIANAPTVDAVEVVHARWAHLGGDEWCCTACGEVIHTEGSWEKPEKKYCYECGAKMDLEVEE